LKLRKVSSLGHFFLFRISQLQDLGWPEGISCHITPLSIAAKSGVSETNVAF
jgi:hypothetical protein